MRQVRFFYPASVSGNVILGMGSPRPKGEASENVEAWTQPANHITRWVVLRLRQGTVPVAARSRGATVEEDPVALDP